MQETLIAIVVIAVFVLIAFAIVRWMGVQIPAIVMQIGGYLVVGIFIVIVIRLLWPLLTGGSLDLGLS